MSRFLIVVDGEFKHDIANSGTDYIYTDMGQGEPGSVSQHTINPGDTLESISTTYFGSSAYWYLIAEANGIENSESLKPGTTLTIPGVVTNSVNNHETYKVYNKADIIGSESSTIDIKEKEKTFWQKVVSVLVVVIVIAAVVAATVLTAGLTAPLVGAAALGGSVTAAWAVTGVILLAAGFAAGVAIGALTQGLEMMAGLRSEFKWKDAIDVGVQVGMAALSGGAAAWTSTLGVGGQILAGGSSNLVQQGVNYIEDPEGFNFNITGFALALIPAASKLSGNWKALADNKQVIGAGLSIIENSAESGEISPMQFASFATATINAELGQSANNFSTQLAVVGGQVAFAAITMGEDAALQTLGQGIGSSIGTSLGQMGAGYLNSLTASKNANTLTSNKVPGPKTANDSNDTNVGGRSVQRVNGQYVDASGKPLTAQQLAEYGLDNPRLASNEQGDTMTDVSGGIDSDASTQAVKSAAAGVNGTGNAATDNGYVPETPEEYVAMVYAKGDTATVDEIASAQLILENLGGEADALQYKANGKTVDGVDGKLGSKTTAAMERFIRGESPGQIAALADQKSGGLNASDFLMQDVGDKPVFKLVKGTKPASSDTLNLRQNSKYQQDIEFAAQRTGRTKATIAALINAEADKKNGVWDPMSKNKSSTAAGLTQFLEGTWIDEAKRSDTYLNQRAKELGFIDDKNKITNKEGLLDLRYSSRESIVAAAEMGNRNLNRLIDAGLVKADADEQALAQAMYTTHQSGYEGAKRVLNVDNKPNAPILTQATATSLLTKQIGPERATANISQQRGNAPQAYREWLQGHMDEYVDPSKFK